MSVINEKDATKIAKDVNASPADLALVAYEYPGLQKLVYENENAYDDLRAWIKNYQAALINAYSTPKNEQEVEKETPDVDFATFLTPLPNEFIEDEIVDEDAGVTVIENDPVSDKVPDEIVEDENSLADDAVENDDLLAAPELEHREFEFDSMSSLSYDDDSIFSTDNKSEAQSGSNKNPHDVLNLGFEADYEDAGYTIQETLDPNIDLFKLAKIAEVAKSLRPYVALNPSIYPELSDWLKDLNDENVNKAFEHLGR
ncbi:MAG: hypothetical protein LBL41_04510 [Bifidobacteriaceae bacterium]|nr:hypothetical protein [Bifidobacteriaceae bacterium]